MTFAATAKPAEKKANPLNPFGTSVAAVDPLDSLRKFVRTAELKFRVREVLPATLQIEDIALHNHGFVTVSNLSSEVEQRSEQPISRDSALETTRFSVHAHLTIRVPYRQLDTTLRAMNRLVDYLDYRNVKAEDVALKMMEDQLLQLRQRNYQREISNAAQSGKSGNKMEAADRTLESRTAADQSRIDRLKLEDALQFSTVEIDIYQAAQIKRQTIANTEIRPVEMSFWRELGDALRSGAGFLEMLVIGLVQAWAFILLIGLAYWAWKKYRRS